MRDNLKLLFADNLIKISLLSSLILILIQVLLILIFFTKLPPLIPFLNSQPWGVERLSSSSTTLFLPAFLIAVFFLNNFLSATFYKRNTLIARILSFNSLLFISLSVFAYIQIIFLVF